MSKSYTFWILVLIAWLFFGTYLWQKYLCDCWSSNGETSAQSTIPSTAWAIKDSTLFDISVEDHLRFLRSSSSHFTPLSDNLTAKLGEVATYMIGHPNRALKITGFYADNETNNSVLPNLGLARANEVKAYLNSLGISSNHVSLEGQLLGKDQKWFKGDTLLNGIDFSFGAVKTSNERLASIKKRLLGKPIMLYFATNQNQIALTKEQRDDFADCIYYIDNVSTSSLNIGGHTDNMGKKSTNILLSLQRAEFVKKYLETNGNIPENRMKTRGFESTKPLVPNTTPENMARNRRVEIILN
jgi:OmpA-OmpF porin, OOP family